MILRDLDLGNPPSFTPSSQLSELLSDIPNTINKPIIKNVTISGISGEHIGDAPSQHYSIQKHAFDENYHYLDEIHEVLLPLIVQVVNRCDYSGAVFVGTWCMYLDLWANQLPPDCYFNKRYRRFTGKELTVFDIRSLMEDFLWDMAKRDIVVFTKREHAVIKKICLDLDNIRLMMRKGRPFKKRGLLGSSISNLTESIRASVYKLVGSKLQTSLGTAVVTPKTTTVP